MHQYIVMVMAGFTGNPHMIACTVLALTKLVHDYQGIVALVQRFVLASVSLLS